MYRNTVLLVFVILAIVVIVNSRSFQKRHGRRRHRLERPRHRGRHAPRPVFSERRNRQRDWYSKDRMGLSRPNRHSKDWEDELEDLFRGWARQRRFNFNFDDKFWLDLGWNTKEEGPWWEGPNVCQDRTENVENTTIANAGPISRHFSMHSQVCDESETSYKCTTTTGIFLRKKTVVDVYECCHGFTRKQGLFGCPTEFRLENLVKTAENLGLTEFLQSVESVSLMDELEKGNFTVFAPVNKAFKEEKNLLPEAHLRLPNDMPNVVMVSKPLTNLVIADMTNVLSGHLVYDIIKTSNLNDEQLIETASPYNSELRVNFYSQPEKLITVNCARILSADNQATNGIIHTIDKVIQPVTKTIIDVITKSPEMSFLKTALAKAELVKTLRGDGQFTLFAPTDNAFRKMDPDLRDRLLKGDKSCLEKVLKNHLLPSVICSTAIQGKARTANLLKKYLNVTRSKDDKLFVENSQMIDRDIMTTNGVIHVIEDVLIPDEALGLLHVAKKNNLTEFVQLLNGSGLLKDIQKMENVTMFVPSDAAIQKFREKMSGDSLKKNNKKVEEMIMYHVVPEVISCNRLRNNYQLDSKAKDKKIRINGYSVFPYPGIQTAQCGRIIHKNLPACNGVINIVDKVLLPPVGNVVDVLASDKQYSMLLGLLKKSGLADMLQETGPFTLFAPTNQALNGLSREDLDELEENVELLKQVLKNHIVEENICCAAVGLVRGIFGSARIWAMSDNSFSLHKYHDARYYGPAKVTECDQTATNGVVHAVNEVILQQERPFFNHDFWKIRW